MKNYLAFFVVEVSERKFRSYFEEELSDSGIMVKDAALGDEEYCRASATIVYLEDYSCLSSFEGFDFFDQKPEEESVEADYSDSLQSLKALYKEAKEHYKDRCQDLFCKGKGGKEQKIGLFTKEQESEEEFSEKIGDFFNEKSLEVEICYFQYGYDTEVIILPFGENDEKVIEETKKYFDAENAELVSFSVIQ